MANIFASLVIERPVPQDALCPSCSTSYLLEELSFVTLQCMPSVQATGLIAKDLPESFHRLRSRVSGDSSDHNLIIFATGEQLLAC